MERRKSSISKPSPLPVDYLRMVTEVFSANFDSGLKIYGQYCPNPYFEAKGEVSTNEIVLAVSLMSQGQLSATTVYASCDFDPKASSPSVQDLLSACLDAVGSVFATLLSPENPKEIAKLADESLSSLESVPFHWTEYESDKKRVYILLDKANLKLDNLADEWLKKHDPELKQREFEEEKQTEDLFFTGPKQKKPSGNDSGQIH